jgi:hypothetical protein
MTLRWTTTAPAWPLARPIELSRSLKSKKEPRPRSQTSEDTKDQFGRYNSFNCFSFIMFLINLNYDKDSFKDEKT